MSRPYITYFSAGPWPCVFGVAPDEAAFDREMKRIGIDVKDPFVPEGSDGAVHILLVDGIKTFVVCLNKRPRGAARAIGIGLAVHEATHVWQLSKAAMGEETPGREIEAYAIQWITQCILSVVP